MTCRKLHILVEAKSSITLKDSWDASDFAALALVFANRFSSSKGLANAYRVELDFDVQGIDYHALEELGQALSSLPSLIEFETRFPLGLRDFWARFTLLIPTCIKRLKLNCHLAVRTTIQTL